MKPISILLLSMLVINAFSQPARETLSWVQQTSGTNNMLTSSSFINVNQGWVVGGNGTILHTGDGGLEWTPQSSGTINNLYKVAFLDDMHGWACGNNGTILSTTNGGINWNLQNSGTTDAILSICFVDVLNGWATSWCDLWPNFGNILHTQDGGQTWVVQNTGLNDWAMLTDICFIDPLHGWVGGFYYISVLRTNDGGNTWEMLEGSAGSYDLQFLGQDIGLSCGNSGIQMTTDGGATWQSRYSSDNALYAICFTDNYYGYAVGEYGEFATTINGGYTWTGFNLEFPYTFHGVSFPERDTGWIVGNNGMILHTTNGGFVGVQEPMISNHPNPFAYKTSIEYQVDRPGWVTLTIFNQCGQKVRDLVDEMQMQGEYQVNWEAEGLPEGIYIYRLTTNGKTSTGKMVRRN